jgi:hypothetical protein
VVKLPDPPGASRLQALGAELVPLARGTRLHRIYFAGGAHPVAWGDLRWLGPTLARFDHHRLPRGRQRRGILHAARDAVTCVGEVFQQRRVIDLHVNDPRYVAFELTRDIDLLDLTGKWPTRAGASTAIHSGNRGRTRKWSAAIYEAFPKVEGLLYCSSMDANRPIVAIYERAEDAIPTHPVAHRSLADPSMRAFVEDAANQFGYWLPP